MKDKWIKVEDRKPTLDVFVWVYSDELGVSQGYRTGFGYEVDDEDVNPDHYTITHWQDIDRPSKPKAI
tara:strand:- start:253 stop:456 length:204 start_codon:yes stop_codon:yes gene_type:complete